MSNDMGKFELWFFRDTSDEQRSKLFSVFGMPVSEISNQSHQQKALRHILSRFATPAQAPALEANQQPVVIGLAPSGWLYQFEDRPPVFSPEKHNWADKHPLWKETPLYAAPALEGNQPEQDRFIRAGKHLHETAKSIGWLDDGEGAYEFATRAHYEAGLEASRSKVFCAMLATGVCDLPSRLEANQQVIETLRAALERECGGLELLRRAVEAGDPKSELIFRIDDLISALAALTDNPKGE